MIHKRLTLTLFTVALITALPAAAETATASQAFERLKTLVGTWAGEGADGALSVNTYRLTGGGTVLVEEFEARRPGQMTTMYHLDGKRLLLTHYCVAGNQPRMAADLSGAAEGRLEFTLVDATNLDDPAEGHMAHVVIRLVDEDTMEQAWTFRQGGEEAFTEAVRYRRVR